jgi:hypothetical protein
MWVLPIGAPMGKVSWLSATWVTSKVVAKVVVSVGP